MGGLEKNEFMADGYLKLRYINSWNAAQIKH